jgi:N6-L-threonylcarbamoyladenine synthase
VLILAIESSCDESSAALIENGRLLAVETRTQTVHQPYGGVVPELAGRSHLELMDAVVRTVARQAGTAFPDVDLFAATAGPGLVGSLLVGISYARGLATALEKRFRAVHHLEAHLWSAELSAGELPPPFLVLLVSGGHTLLVLVSGVRNYHVLGSTRDDALGEAYDKVGKLLGLPFPAGAEVDRLAAQGDGTRFAFPVSMNDASADFSFSGLKTAVAYRVRGMSDREIREQTSDLLASFQAAALASVLLKVESAMRVSGARAVVAAGGVAANSQLRLRLGNLAAEWGVPCFFPQLQFCGDNAAMIGYLAWKLETAGIRDGGPQPVRPRWPLELLGTGDATP